MTGRPMPVAGALSALLGPALRRRVGWTPDADRPPDAAWEAAEGRIALSTGERAMVAIALGLWNGTRAGVDVSVLGQLDGGNLRRLAGCLDALAAGGFDELLRWARAELAPPPDFPPEA